MHYPYEDCSGIIEISGYGHAHGHGHEGVILTLNLSKKKPSNQPPSPGPDHRSFEPFAPACIFERIDASSRFPNEVFFSEGIKSRLNSLRRKGDLARLF